MKIIKESNQYVYLPVKLQRCILQVFRFRPPPRRTSLRSALARRCSPAFALPPPRSPRNSSSQSIPHRTIRQYWIRKLIYKSINNVEFHSFNFFSFFFQEFEILEFEKWRKILNLYLESSKRASMRALLLREHSDAGPANRKPSS